MTSKDDHFAVMFADVSGSTRLYETLGDKDAKALIGDIVDRMSALTREHDGIVIKTIGDEVMCRFSCANAGISAACAIQEHMERWPPIGAGTRLAVRIGIHWGPALLEGGDVFGDAVNVAARMAGIAKARQIITTEDTVRALRPELADKARLFDRVQVKGRQAELLIHELVWEQRQDVTTLVPIQGALGAAAVPPLFVRLSNGDEKQVPSDGRPFVLGRGDGCDLVVPGGLTSRQHARIECRRGKYILVDQSTNGTWVRTEDGKEVYLRREELPLWGTGQISLGETIGAGSPTTIHFAIQGE